MTKKGKKPTLAVPKVLKRQKLRNNEYYNMQEIFDELYEDSIKNYEFKNLTKIISSDENIKLAYRNLRKNKGSKTAGSDKKTIDDLSKLSEIELVSKVKHKFEWYKPQSVRRVEIPKDNGKTRPLGIPTIMDRLIQQCILQVLEPICEAKFHDKSNGFRPNRGVENALAQFEKLIQISNMYIVIDIDIKGFFDNVSHSKLLKQMWALGIREKKLLSIISAMLKSEVVGIGFPEKGTPQGGIISPLLSNIVLNELDWWISSQWETIPTKKEYINKKYSNGTIGRGKTFRALKTTKLKECFIVRYADDFKIVCRKHSDAIKLFEATKQWLNARLGLEISAEKSKIVNLKHSYSEFLGFRIKVHKKGKNMKTKEMKDKFVVKSHVSKKALQKIKIKTKEHIKKIQFATKSNLDEYARINDYNIYLIGIHNYYKMATHVSGDFQKIAFEIKTSIKIRLQDRVKRKHNNPKMLKIIKEKYGKSKEMRFINGNALVPIGYIRHTPPIHKKKVVNKYTIEGRKEIHKMLEKVDISMVHSLMKSPIKSETIEYNDNRISIYVAQNGKCAILQTTLFMQNIHCHHKKPRKFGGDDSYKNLIILDNDMHKLVHATDENLINELLNLYNLNKIQLQKLNKLRNEVENLKIDENTLKTEILVIN